MDEIERLAELAAKIEERGVCQAYVQPRSLTGTCRCRNLAQPGSLYCGFHNWLDHAAAASRVGGRDASTT